ncbi:MAG: AAA ATPase [Parcubacteria group bacterium Gr01-1014_18]|nr:MAG: AAA ATPase [Parcubacteria group bacterium Greene0416_36]TSC80723.1 MAG: AAA ATPase [Parcubacteria group bacterium Gr01-1014_18]TSC98666.1 MAG: AAA ATPase [Parcubacteria group bacterium Greene1014_20]TSD07174.1 MAG: AAA ATPase [Parcubacteria group bacterium Greene0714_2]
MHTAHTWWDKLRQAYEAELGYVFLISGNISDLFPLNETFLTLKEFVATQLSGREIVVFWDKAAGFTFGDEIIKSLQEPSTGRPRPSIMREKFKSLITGDAAPSSSSTSSSSLLASLGGLGNATDLPTDPERSFQLLEKLISTGKLTEKKAALILEYAESILSENDYVSVPSVTLQRWASLDSPLRGTGNPVILIERNPERVSSAVKHDDSNVVGIHIPRPNRDEHQKFLRWATKAHVVKFGSGLNAPMVANLMAGLRCKDFDDFCLVAKTTRKELDERFIWQKKMELIEKQSGGVLRVVRPKHGFESIGGLEYIKEALRVQVAKLRTGSKTTDKGWILMGPPGTGKTIIAEALAKESGVNFLMLGNIFSKFVGDSERNMRLAMDIAAAMAPTILFVDEAAEAIGSGEEYAGDSGVGNRVRGMLQNVMGDDANRGKLFFILATNYPNRLPPAILREGRMDKRVPLLVPDRETRKKILEALCTKYQIDAASLDFSFALDQSDNWTGAQLEAVLLRAKQFAEETPTQKLTTEILKNAVEDYIPSRDEAAFLKMSQLAIEFTNSRRLLPPQVRPQP